MNSTAYLVLRYKVATDTWGAGIYSTDNPADIGWTLNMTLATCVAEDYETASKELLYNLEAKLVYEGHRKMLLRLFGYDWQEKLSKKRCTSPQGLSTDEYESGYRDGLEAGYEKGLEEGRRKLLQSVASFLGQDTFSSEEELRRYIINRRGMKDATDKVLAEISSERAKQIEKWGDEHDDRHRNEEMAVVAAIWSNPSQKVKWEFDDSGDFQVEVQEWNMPEGWKSPPDLTKEDSLSDYYSKRRVHLVRAAALLVAEIERIDRIEDT